MCSSHFTTQLTKQCLLILFITFAMHANTPRNLLWMIIMFRKMIHGIKTDNAVIVEILAMVLFVIMAILIENSVSIVWFS
jgi:hypothetical protein